MNQSNPPFNLLFEIESEHSEIELSVVLPVFNQADRIISVLTSLTEMMQTDFELIVIDDASEDATRRLILDWATGLDLNEQEHLGRLRFFHSVQQQLETACDSFGFSLCVADYILEVQADMVITERGFEAKMVSAFGVIKNLAAISGRGVEPFSDAFSRIIEKGGTSVSRGRSPWSHALKTIASRILRLIVTDRILKSLAQGRNPEKPAFLEANKATIFPSEGQFLKTKSAGRLGALINENPVPDNKVNYVWTGETVMRGPLMINAERFRRLSGFDTEAFFLGYDDHDFCLRAAVSGFRVGFVPVGFESPEDWGSTRKARTFASERAIIRQRFRVATHFRNSLAYRFALSGQYPKVAMERIALG